MSKNSLFRLCATNKLTNFAVRVVVLGAIIVLTNLRVHLSSCCKLSEHLILTVIQRKQVIRTSSGVEGNVLITG